jgi:hypothetical protein
MYIDVKPGVLLETGDKSGQKAISVLVKSGLGGLVSLSGIGADSSQL